jgi:hypothetical protein
LLLHQGQASNDPECVRPHASALAARTRPLHCCPSHQSCLSWPCLHRYGHGRHGPHRAVCLHSTSHRSIRLLIDQGDRVSRLPSNHALPRPRAAPRPRQLCISGRRRHASAILVPSACPYRLTPKTRKNLFWPHHACRSSRMKMLDFIAVDSLAAPTRRPILLPATGLQESCSHLP